MPPLNGHRGNGARASRNGSGGPSAPIDWERLARATAHPLRISVLEVLGIDGGRTLSPMDLSRELQIPLSNTNYHVTELAKAGLIELVDTRPVRGATEHFYRPATNEKRTTGPQPAAANGARDIDHAQVWSMSRARP